MSRRNRVPRRESAIPGNWQIKISCTDNKQHPEVTFGKVTVWPEGDGWGVLVRGLSIDEYSDIDSVIATVESGAAEFKRIPKTWPIVCRRCGRNVPLKESTIERLCAALAKARRDTLDISDIPT